MIITCTCGTTFEKTGRGRPPIKCEECRKDKRPVISMKHWTSDLNKEALDIHKDLIKVVPIPQDNYFNMNESDIGVELKRELTCEMGHTWMAPVKRGRTPRFCPEHINKAPRISERTVTTKHQGELLRKILEGPAAVSCHCGITPETTPAELRAIGDQSCTHPHHICSILDACRRAMGM